MPLEDASATSGGSLEQYPVASSSKQSRIYFPADNSGPSGLSHRPLENGQRLGPSVSRTYSTKRNFTSIPRTPPSKVRRRVKSVGNGVDEFVDPHHGSASNYVTPPRPSHSYATRVARVRGRRNRGSVPCRMNMTSAVAHEDPRILQDVQRALKLKARREARLGGRSTSIKIDQAQQAQVPTNGIPEEVPRPIPLSPTGPRSSSDIDFRPSTEPFRSGLVPSSLDNGRTLDWSGEEDKTDARWKLASMSKRKGKESYPPVKAILEKQEISHADKIARLRTIASPNTLRKAEIINEQFRRRYNLVYTNISQGVPFNIAAISRWYASQEQLVRSTLEKAEPFTWLKHLEKRATPGERSPRNLTALIMEEYLHARAHHDPMTPIPEDAILPNPPPEKPGSSPLRPVLSRGSTNRLFPPLFERKISHDDGVSFEPFVESARNSLESRRSNESSFSSLPIGASATSPPSRNASVMRSPESAAVKKEDVFKAEQSDGSKRADIPRQSLTLSPASKSEDEGRVTSPGITIQLTAASPGPISGTHSQTSLPNSPKPNLNLSPGVDRVIGRRRARARSRSPELRPKANERRVKRNVSSDKSYAQKTRLLEEASTHNHKMRQLLNRISGAVRDYEATQNSAMASLGVKYKGLPKELLDAFGHDPAAVTGNTRRFRGWRAVDDIHQRLIRQQSVLQDFVLRTSAEISIPRSVLDDPIESLVSSLDVLETHCERIGKHAKEVAERLGSVQEVHSSTKESYKKTLSHTSVVYPELSHIVALEESYKDQYQQFWEFGMDTLTFFLDTITPVWRTYGTTIGKDIQDFLIIPLYRNEFTGEAKRYPIYRVPTRSLRHWMGLLLFAVLSIAINILQMRAAISSSINYHLRMIPYEGIRWTALPFFWVGIFIQWLAVITELAIVLMQVVIIIWWLGWTIRLVH